MAGMTKESIRKAAEKDLLTFARLVGPHRVYGPIHEALFKWWTRPDAKDNQLCLFPRDHQKSHCLAVRVAWEITRNPAITILYVSATSALAEKQLYAIKNIISSKIYQRYWPEMVNPIEGKREKWSATEIAVDHPLRSKEGVRDSTVFAAGLTTNITGFHCNVAALDDVVVPNNVNTNEGRNKVASMYSQLSSIETTEAREWVVGTRYDARDLYSTMLDLEEEIYDSKGVCTSSEKVYEVFEKSVEDSPERNGSGTYLWPRMAREDGKYFGFDAATLARKRAKYVDRHQFFAQYYNDPNDSSNAPVQLEWVQYYNKEHLVSKQGQWYLGNKRLNVVAAMDFAFSVAKMADYSAIAVIGIDEDHNIYVLDVERFKTSSYREMFDRALASYTRWDFGKLRCEVSAGQKAVIEQFKTYMGEDGIYFAIDEYNPRYQGSKVERMHSILTPRYENRKMWHFRGGACQQLEEEVRKSRPAHDDMKDALASAIDFARPPSKRRTLNNTESNVVVATSRFGGMR